MRRALPLCGFGVLALIGCAHEPMQKRGTLAQLRTVVPETQEVRVEDGLDRAMDSYRRYLVETPKTRMTPEAMRRLADLKVEKQFGLLGDGKLLELAAQTETPERMELTTAANDRPKVGQSRAAGIADVSESLKAFEQRATAQNLTATHTPFVIAKPGAADVTASGPLEAIALYDQLLSEYPNYEHADKVLYQKSRAYDELGRTEEAMKTMERLITTYPHSRYADEVQFRRAEYFFTRRKYRDAEGAYSAIIATGSHSEYYELALYKLGWTYYKQEFYDEALRQYLTLLDQKVSIGYDFDARHEEGDERRIADTFRVISLSFSNLGGPDIAKEYFASNGQRSYEHRVYSNLGEFYFAKLRYHDAAAAYNTFIKLYPFHKTSPHFAMRVVEIYTKGGFQKLVLDAKKEFAKTYALQAEYWRHFTTEESPEVFSYLKSNLKDLANHYHAQYQRDDLKTERPDNLREALQWYREFLGSFPRDPESPVVNYQLADLLLEDKSYLDAAHEYEHTAYDYAPHEKASSAGYAAIYAYRELLKSSRDAERQRVKQDTVASSLKFADTFPQHEHAAEVLGAAADDLYEMRDLKPALAAAQKLIERYPTTELGTRRSAWTVVAHASFDLAEYTQAESAYARVLEIVPERDPKYAGFVENLAASIYKQGEQANAAQDFRGAANHFLRVKKAAPGARKISAAAEYDAAAALIRLEDWTAAAEVLEAFRRDYPGHELAHEATKQIAHVYKQSGNIPRAAGEYERIATESSDPATRGEALLLAGDLHRQSSNVGQALLVYQRYVADFPKPLELAVETHFKIAELFKESSDTTRYREQLQRIVGLDAKSGGERTDRIRYLAAKSALVLAETLCEQFAQVRLTQPFERSLKEKRQRMDAAVKALGALVNYQVGEVTAGATYYMAEIYYGFNRALIESERPKGLKPAESQKYELDLEETAFPYEERAITVHEKNLELVRGGIYNAWIEKSLAKLAQLMPARYAKDEMSSGFQGSIDRYAYRAPAALLEAPKPEAATTVGQVAAPVANSTLMAVGVQHVTP